MRGGRAIASLRELSGRLELDQSRIAQFTNDKNFKHEEKIIKRLFLASGLLDGKRRCRPGIQPSARCPSDVSGFAAALAKIVL